MMTPWFEFNPRDAAGCRAKVAEGVACHGRGDYAAALKVFQWAESMDPFNGDVALNLAMALLSQNNTTDALTVLYRFMIEVQFLHGWPLVGDLGCVTTIYDIRVDAAVGLVWIAGNVGEDYDDPYQLYAAFDFQGRIATEAGKKALQQKKVRTEWLVVSDPLVKKIVRIHNPDKLGQSPLTLSCV